MNKALGVGLAILVLAGAAIAGVSALKGASSDAAVSVQQGTAATAAEQASTTAPDDTIRTLSRSADFGVIYTSFEQLTAASDAVVRGRVLETRYTEYNEGVWTVSTIKVQKAWGAGVAPGDTITIVEAGGVTSEAFLKRTTGRPPTSPTTAEDEQSKVQLLLEGAPLPKAGEESVYFLAKGTWEIVPGPYYDVVGAFQGKLKVNSNRASRYAPEGWSSAYRALDGDVARVEAAVGRTKPGN